MGLKDASLIQKLFMSFAVVLVCSAGASGLLLHLDGQASSMLDASQQANVAMVHLSHAATAHLDQAHTMRGFLLTGVERHAKLYQSAVSLFHEEIVAAQNTANIDEEVKQALNKVEAASLTWRQQIGDPAIQKYRDKAIDEALAIARAPRASELQQAFRDQLALAETKIQNLSNSRQQSIRSSLWLISISQIIGGLVSLVVAIVSGVWLYSSIGEPVKRITKLMAELAAGNIKVNVPFITRKDELGSMARTVQVFKDMAIKRLALESEAQTVRLQSDAVRASREAEKDAEAQILRIASQALSEGLDQLVQGHLGYRIEVTFDPSLEPLRISFNQSMEKLQATISAIHSNADSIKIGAGEIADASDDLSRRTEQQAANVEQTAAALSDITSTVERTAQGAKQAQDIVFGAQSDAKHSDSVSSSLMSLLKQFQFSAAAPVQTGVPKDKLRWELKKAVPHVFRQNRPVPAGTSAKGEIKPLRAVVSGVLNMEETVNAGPEHTAGPNRMADDAQHLADGSAEMIDTGEKAPAIIELRGVLNVTAALPTAKQFIEHRGRDIFVDGANVQHLGGQGLQILLSALRTWTEDVLAMTMTVLTVDDSRTMRDMLKFALTNGGYRVIQAVDGVHGLEVLEQETLELEAPNVIITDINMPNLDGFGFIEHVRKDDRFRFVPIIVLTTEADAEKKNKARQAGATGWVVKPFDPVKLLEIIRRVSP
eukprot:gene16508-16686_t